MRSGNLEQALMIFNSILLNDLQDPIRHLDHSRALLELLEYKEAIDGFKKVVTLVRRRKRFPKSSSSQEDEVIERKFVGERYVLYAAYTGLGKSYEGTERGDRAIACYTLALKSIRPRDSNFDGDSWDHFFVGDCEISLSRLLSASTTAAAGSVLPPHRPTLAGAQQPVADIEDYLQDFSLTPIEGQFRFSCTSCGECCRTSDRILLSPQDIFRLTRSAIVRSFTGFPSLPLFLCPRSSALGFLGITTTTSLLAHSRFQVCGSSFSRLTEPPLFCRREYSITRRGRAILYATYGLSRKRVIVDLLTHST
jgi:tetratricopeptide (TPR) repeat protein